MKISRNWLQTFFDAPLPDATALGDALTFHAFEIDGIEHIEDVGHPMSYIDDILDVKVTANRGHDCLCYLGIAREISAILNIPLKKYPHTISMDELQKKTDALSVTIENPEMCPRFCAVYIRGVKVGPSPAWLVERLESMGQRSINNVVDATNFVMFNIGQPMHAFDAKKLASSDKLLASSTGYKLNVRNARDGEKMLGLDDKEYALTPAMLTITDSNAGDVPVSVAGIKGGKPTGIDESTTDVILEAANWDGPTIRKTSQVLKLRTDASSRFEQIISPDLAPFGIRAITELVTKMAGGEVAGFVDEYPSPQKTRTVSVTLSRINGVLGTKFAAADVTDVFNRLGLPFAQEGETFAVTPPFERLDLVIPEDLIEEVGRIIGYDKIPNTELPAADLPTVNEHFYAAEKMREELMAQGYSEVFTSVFTDKGERVVANKVDGVRPYLRNNLTNGLADAVKKNIPNKELLGLKEIKLFEIGTIWHKDSEEIVYATVSEKGNPVQKPLVSDAVSSHYDGLAVSTTMRYQTFSRYPFVVRDIALWVPAGTEPANVLKTIRENGGELLLKYDLFDRFEKGEKVSLAFRLIFQSFERTLTDVEVNMIMGKVSAALKAENFEIR